MMLSGQDLRKSCLLLRKKNEADFKAVIGDRMQKHIEVEYVYQELTNLPEGYSVPEGRVKPYGTGHAILSCLNAIDGPFAVINADDYYGKNAYQMITIIWQTMRMTTNTAMQWWDISWKIH